MGRKRQARKDIKKKAGTLLPLPLSSIWWFAIIDTSATGWVNRFAPARASVLFGNFQRKKQCFFHTLN